jgi:NAD(P)H-hydrate repair Nnr-like enzyme with NAD(P)H-hydrate dehydratase domain
MLAIVGTVPDRSFPLIEGEVSFEGSSIAIGGSRINVRRGTPALMASAIKACEVLDLGRPYGFLAGDIGLGDGSRLIYRHLTEVLAQREYKVLVFHYLQPDVDWHNRVLFAVEEMKKRPLLVADAGFMYAAKMSGQASSYDLFTPDAGEMAFLADEEAPHPFYTRGFILHEDNLVPELITRAYANENASKLLLVKGRHDLVASRDGIAEIISEPIVESLEPIGGTGDTVTGLVAALLCSGMPPIDAAVIAAKANRYAGLLAKPTPATQVDEIIVQMPTALRMVLGGAVHR